MKSSRFWIAVILAVLAAASAASLYLVNQRGGDLAVVTQNGQELYSIRLDKVEEAYSLDIGGDYHNIIEVEPGRIRVAQADCPDGICVETGWISDGAVPIVCLPNGLVIEIRDNGQLDAAVH